MINPLKQRIVGIGVLIFLALILLPWLFGSNQPVVFETKTQAEPLENTDMPETIKMTHPSVQPIPDKLEEQVKPSETFQQYTKPVEPQPTIKSESDHPNLNEVNNKIANIENSIVSAESYPAEVKKAEIPSYHFKAEKKITKPAAKIVITKPKANKNVIIQLGSFTGKENAMKLTQELKAKGYAAYSNTSKNSQGSSITRVFVGSPTRANAEMLMKKIDKTFKIHGIIVKSDL